MHQVIIIEDDPMVAAINRQYVEATPAFQVRKTFKNGAEALKYFKQDTADLIILDYYTPVMNGEEFIDRLHATGQRPAIIMVTSANDSDIVGRLLSRGIIDYLVKPFEYSRFKAALEKFSGTRSVLERSRGAMKQEDIDRLVAGAAAPSQENGKLAKGLNEFTLNLVRDFLRGNPDTLFSSEQLAEQVHLSRITARRYLNYLAETGEIISDIDYQTGGRPAIKYRLLVQPSPQPKSVHQY